MPRPGRPRSSCAGTRSSDAPQSPHRDHRRDPRDVPALLRAARPPAPAVGVARARIARRLGPADDGRDAPARAVLQGRGEAAAPAPGDGPEVLSHDRHRERRQHHPPSHVLRDARQLLDRRLLQARGRAVGVGAVAARLSVQPRRHLDHGLRGRREARHRPRRGGDRGLAVGRRAT